MLGTFEEFVERSKMMVIGQGEHFTEPDDDWMPAAFLESEDGMHIVAMVGFEMNANDKDDLATRLAQLVRETKAERASLVLSMWALDSSVAAARGMGMHHAPDFSAIPGHREILMIQNWGEEHDAFIRAEILRHDDAPPTLGEWKSVGAIFANRFAIVGEALRD